MAEVIITDQNFASEVAQNKLPVLVDFGHPGVARAGLLALLLRSWLKNLKVK